MRWLDSITDSVDIFWANSGREWRTEEPGVLQCLGSQTVGHDLVTEQQQVSAKLSQTPKCLPYPTLRTTGEEKGKKPWKSTCFLELQPLSHRQFWERKIERPFCSWLYRKPRTRPWIKWELEAEWQLAKCKPGYLWPSLAIGTSGWSKRLETKDVDVSRMNNLIGFHQDTQRQALWEGLEDMNSTEACTV